MSLVLNLSPERERRLKAFAARQGKPEAEIVEAWIDTVPAEESSAAEAIPEERVIPTFAEWKRARGERPTEKPKTGAEAVAYWEEFGLLGSYGDMSLSSEEMARKLREESNRPRYA